MAGNIYEEAKSISEASNLSETPTQAQAQKRLKRQKIEGLYGGVLLGHKVHVSTGDELRYNIFYPCRLTDELTRRFCGVGAELMEGVQAFHPAEG